MGDRANVKLIQRFKGEESPIYLYTHWGGEELAATLKAALVRGTDRWNDDTYLARIIFCEMVKGSEAELTGFGIGTHLGDNEHTILEVDSDKQEVRFRTWNWQTYTEGEPFKVYSFTDYCQASDSEIDAAYNGGEMQS